jgi:hypothetical protein
LKKAPTNSYTCILLFYKFLNTCTLAAFGFFSTSVFFGLVGVFLPAVFLTTFFALSPAFALVGDFFTPGFFATVFFSPVFVAVFFAAVFCK